MLVTVIWQWKTRTPARLQWIETELHAGHSLGGALSDLAAYDIAKAAAAAGARLRLACYTFGAPRVGNHAYARDHAGVVPDTWGIINDQARHSVTRCCARARRTSAWLSVPGCL